MVNVHLILAALFMPLLLMMPLSGGLYLLDVKGDQQKTEAFRIPLSEVPADKSVQEAFFRDQFKKQSLDFDFEYVRSTETDFIFRPTTRTHYVATKAGEDLIFQKIVPDLQKRMIELHKGHGPRMMRWFEVLFGLALILTTLSGLWLAWTVKPYRRTTLISFGIGLAFLILCLI